MHCHLILPLSWEECADQASCEKMLHYDGDVLGLHEAPRKWMRMLFPDYLITEDSISTVDEQGELHNFHGPAFEGLPHEDSPFTLATRADKVKTSIIAWFSHGNLHREDGPAVIKDDGSVEWRFYNILHRLDGPALEWADGRQEWYRHGLRHSADSPAIMIPGVESRWYLDGMLHRVDGPAIVRADGSREWYTKGYPHRTGGPAKEHSDGRVSWYVDGVFKGYKQ